MTDCQNPAPHEPHQWLADSDAATLTPCAGRTAAPSTPDDRRERYATAIEREANLGPTALYLAREAAMAVADEEITETLRISDAATNAMRDADRAENARLRDTIERLLAERDEAREQCTEMEQQHRFALEEAQGRALVARSDGLREAAARYEEMLAKATPEQDPRYWTAVRDVTLGLRRMADETQQSEPTSYRQLLAKLDTDRARLLAAPDAPCHEVGIAISGLAAGYLHAILWALHYFEGPDARAQYLRDHAGDKYLTVHDAFPQPRSCAECDHPEDEHEEGDDPVSPGTCQACDNEDDAIHDFQPPEA